MHYAQSRALKLSFHAPPLAPPMCAQVGCYDPMPNYNKEIVVGLNIERIK